MLLSKISRRFTASLARGTTQNKTTRGGGACSSVSFGRLCRLHTFLSLSLSLFLMNQLACLLFRRGRAACLSIVFGGAVYLSLSTEASQNTLFFLEYHNATGLKENASK